MEFCNMDSMVIFICLSRERLQYVLLQTRDNGCAYQIIDLFVHMINIDRYSWKMTINIGAYGAIHKSFIRKSCKSYYTYTFNAPFGNFPTLCYVAKMLLLYMIIICRNRFSEKTYPDSKVHGTNMGPTWVLSAPDRPHVGPINLAIRVQPCL